ncbi:MAG: TonB-dependent receptor [Woeseia sp.]
MYTKTPLASAISLVLAAGALGIGNQVLAQEAEEEVQELAPEEIVVTGSRIRKDVFTSSAPMDVIDIGEASVAGIASVGELLQTNTVASGSPQVTAATSFEFVQNGGLGASTLSLRGLGANRTLVLLNGRRAGPAGVRGGVSSFDLNVLPLSTIQRVEVLKDGASSIYGSDAVAGVVNIITRKDDGASVDAFLSMPNESGGEESRISASWGKTFSRGNFRLTADYMREEELARGDRDYFECGNQYIFDQATGERADIIDPRSGRRHCEDLTWGHVWLYDYAAGSNVPDSASLLAQFDYDNDLGQHIPGYAVDPNNPEWLSTPPGFFPVGYDPASDAVTNDDHPFQDQESLIPKNELMTFYAEAEYELTEELTAYSEVLLNRRETTANGYRQYWSYIYSSNFDFVCGLGAGCGNPQSAGWSGAQWYSPTAITDHNDSKVEVDYYRALAGLRGELTETWSWDFSFNYSRSDGDYTNDVIFDDAISDQNFLVSSCEGTTTSIRGIPCVDIPWLDPELLRGNVSPEVRDFLFGTETGNTKYTQWSVDGFMTGEAMDLPAGPLGVAVGFQYREDEIRDVPGEITHDAATGLSNAWLDSAGITEGDDKTYALFAELNVPVLTDLPVIRNLTFNASGRYTDVDSYGDDTTWKIGMNWQIIDTVRLRANRGTSFRAPALFELYIANQTGSISQRADPCIDYAQRLADGDISQTLAANCAADPAGLPPDYTGGTVTPTVITGGGLGVLEAETSESNTIGLIWQPEFADLSMSIDYFDIEVKDEVDQLGGERIILECYESEFGFAFGDTEPLCDLFDRSGINLGLDNVRDSFLNIARQTNRGFDYAIRYITEVPWVAGSLTVDLRATRQIEDTRAFFEDTAEDLNGLVGDPVWVGNSDVTLDRGPWTFFWGMDYVGTSSNEEHFGGNLVTYRDVDYRGVLFTEAVRYHAFSVSREFEESGWTALVGVANAFDQEPPQLTSVQTSAEYTMVGNSLLVSQYDWLGRRFFLNVNKTFE